MLFRRLLTYFWLLPKQLQPLSLTIHTKELVKQYRNRTVVNRVSIDVKQGKYRIQVYEISPLDFQNGLYLQGAKQAKKWRACFLTTANEYMWVFINSLKPAMEKAAKSDDF